MLRNLALENQYCFPLSNRLQRCVIILVFESHFSSLFIVFMLIKLTKQFLQFLLTLLNIRFELIKVSYRLSSFHLLLHFKDFSDEL